MLLQYGSTHPVPHPNSVHCPFDHYLQRTIEEMIRPERKSSITPSLVVDASGSATTPRMRGSRVPVEVKEIEIVKQHQQQLQQQQIDVKDGGSTSKNSDRWTTVPTTPTKICGSLRTQPTIGLSLYTSKASVISEDTYDDDYDALGNIPNNNEDGSLGGGTFGMMIVDGIDPRPTGLNEDRVRAFLVDYYEDFNSIAPQKVRECWNAFYSRFYTPYYFKVRSSGNSIDQEGLIDLYMSKDLILKEMVLISIDSIQLVAGGLVAVACYTADQKFEYKGTYNHDRTVYSVVLEEINGEPKIVQEQRTTGVPVPSKESRWECNAGSDDSHCSAGSHSVPLQDSNNAAAAATTNGGGGSEVLASSSRSQASISSMVSSRSSTPTAPPRPPTHIVEDSNNDQFILEDEVSEDGERKKPDDDYTEGLPVDQSLLQRPAFDDDSRRVVFGVGYAGGGRSSRSSSPSSHSPIQPRRQEFEETTNNSCSTSSPPRPPQHLHDSESVLMFDCDEDDDERYNHVEDKEECEEASKAKKNRDDVDNGGDHINVSVNAHQMQHQNQRPAFEDTCRPVVEASKLPPARLKSTGLTTAKICATNRMTASYCN